MLDAPVSGGEQGAINGMLSIMAGGDAQIFERCRLVATDQPGTRNSGFTTPGKRYEDGLNAFTSEYIEPTMRSRPLLGVKLFGLLLFYVNLQPAAKGNSRLTYIYSMPSRAPSSPLPRDLQL